MPTGAAASNRFVEATTTAGRIAGVGDGGVIGLEGVPYAASAAGANRLRPLQPRTAWDGLRDATACTQSCPQPAEAVALHPDVANVADFILCNDREAAARIMS